MIDVEGYSSEILFTGPDDVQLVIRASPNRYSMTVLGGTARPATDFYVWSIHNRALTSLRDIRLEISEARSFDHRKSAFREATNLRFRRPVLRDLEAGGSTSEAIFLKVDRDQVRLWSHDGRTLPWPSGDQGPTRRWRLTMRVLGLSKAWLIGVDLRLTRQTRVLEIAKFDVCPGDRFSNNAQPAELPLDGKTPVSGAAAIAPSLPTTRRRKKVPGRTKGDVSLLKKGDGTLYESVDFPTAERYAGISGRRRQQLISDGDLKTSGQGLNRRVTVASLIQYCPSAEDAK